jgi:hypothetical protein
LNRSNAQRQVIARLRPRIDLDNRGQSANSRTTDFIVDVSRKYSSSPKWESTWKKEIKGGKIMLSRYALVSATEGFAELHRAIVQKGVGWNVGKVFHGDRLAFQFDLLPEPGHHRPAFVNLQQYYFEEYMVRRAEVLACAEIRWKHRVVGVERDNQPQRLVERRFAAHDLLLGDKGSLTPRVDWSYQSSMYTFPNNAPTNLVSAYGLLNARMAWRSSQDTWEATVFVTNLTDKFYYLNKFDGSGAPFFVVNGQPGRPREWGVTLKRDF